MITARKYDAIIVGSGPNGLSAAITLQRQGLATLVVESASIPGGSVRTAALTLPGYLHDVGAAIHPLAVASPFFKSLVLEKYGLSWIRPEIPFAHPFSDGSALAAFQDPERTARSLGRDQQGYRSLIQSLLPHWEDVMPEILGPLHWPAHPFKTFKFGLRAIRPANAVANRFFREEKSKAFFYGAAAHGTIPLTSLASASFGLVLFLLAHTGGWPFPKGGAGEIVSTLIRYYQAAGGTLETGVEVTDLRELPETGVYLLDLTPRQVLRLNGTNFGRLYRSRLARYRYGAGIFKIDYALDRPAPFLHESCRKAGTVHLGFSTNELIQAEKVIHMGKVPDRPYVLFAQHSVFDHTRAPEGKHTAWAYCHVPNSNITDMTGRIEAQIEKAAPGFRDCILQRVTHNTRQMETFNANLIGGDINGGKQDIFQMFTRPVAGLSPYSTPDPAVYICSSSTPPGGGVHGMCGYHAAKRVLRDHFTDIRNFPDISG